MTEESARNQHEMEELGFNTAGGDKTTKFESKLKHTYRVLLTNEQAMAIRDIDASAESENYKIRYKDAQRCQKDLKIVDQKEKTLRDKEDRFEAAIAKYEALLELKTAGQSLTTEQQSKISSFNLKQVESILEATRTKREGVSERKQTLWKRTQSMQKELKEMRKDGDGNLMERTKDGQWVKYYKNAPSNVVQTIDRPNSEIARELARKFCRSEEIKNLTYKDTELIKEYKQSYKPHEEMYHVCGAVLENIDANKLHMNRWGYLNAVFPVLTPQMQTLTKIAVTTLMTGDTAYDMKLPIMGNPRREKMNLDGKSKFHTDMKIAIRDNNLKRNFEKVSTGYKKPYQDKKPYTPKKRYDTPRKNTDTRDTHKPPFTPKGPQKGGHKPEKKAPYVPKNKKPFNKGKKHIKNEPKGK